MKTDSFETEKCLIREIELGDSNQIVAWRSNPEVYRYFKRTIKINLESHIDWFNNSYLKNQDRIDLLVILKSTEEKIGVFGINRIDENSAEVSYLLDEKYQGKGYASEVLKGIETQFMDKWGIKVFVAEIHKDNNNSLSFIQKQGYSKTSTHSDYYIFSKKV